MIRSFAFASVVAVTSGSVIAGDAYTAAVEKVRASRLETLKAPAGWLSLIGLEWLQPGANRVGSAADNDIVLKAGPAHLGVVTLDDTGNVTLEVARGSGVLVDGREVQRATLVDDGGNGGKATEVRFGSANFFVIARDGKKALRVKDEKAETRTHFVGLDYFPVDPSWRVEAEWVPFDPPHEIEIGSVLGTIDKEKVPGKAVFTRDGHTYELFPIQEEPDSLFFVFADRTSGKETYGAARFLDTPLAKDGKLVLDFNEARNPPCAFTPYATCPLAPPENRLDVRVTAGEKKYAGGHG
ncbi:MAG: DUF1684 domain-containing protein [Luteibacter sp.]|uniref:DUF1684 domain-containing protein n=1 Tax=Rhodanobacteraceae TaxID=1775411 RepID=UPI00055B6CAB|nr:MULTISPECIES: DUF1684 domain-containing protein [Rhodanobacteraceae]MDQ7997805.1 DUF1684 domain-containing protein [Luteibacter sp.]MDQ8050216.1 DUF1684 domain-containing protein [Luteibacter sp.]SDG99990.1 hypothetical protein SAMN04515659_3930 [Dyella sp. 333MFSha]